MLSYIVVCTDVMHFSDFARDVFVTQLLCVKRRRRTGPASKSIIDSLTETIDTY